MLVTLVILRLRLPHQALAVLYGVDRATVTRAVHEVRTLLARRGFAVPDAPGVRLHTLPEPPICGSSARSTWTASPPSSMAALDRSSASRHPHRHAQRCCADHGTDS